MSGLWVDRTFLSELSALHSGGVAVPELQISVAGDTGIGQAVRFNVIYGCSEPAAMSMAQESGNPVVVIRGGHDAEAEYFIYSWDDRAEKVIRAASDDGAESEQPLPVPQQRSARQSPAGPCADDGERKVAHYRAAL
jgi:hypothetical protein